MSNVRMWPVGAADTPAQATASGRGATDTSDLIHFGPFSLSPTTHILQDAGRPVRLGSRALEILLLLVENAGRFVSNAEIVQRVWPRNVVVDGNLRVHIAGLRKALGDGQEGRRYIVNAPNRGYSFVGEVSTRSVELAVVQAPPERAPRPAAGAWIPTPLIRVIGQEDAIRTLGRRIASQRLVTLVGAGGIGKTTVALAAVAAATNGEMHSRWSSIHFVDLASHTNPSLVPAALALALGLGSVVGDTSGSLIAFLHDKRALIVVDNCEHLVAPLAVLIESILRAAPGVHVLATSREPLRAEGEWIQRLQPLAVPPAGARLSAPELMRFSAVELFVDRCAALVDQFSLHDADAAAVGVICRRLDGIPLAIELAAARVGSFGLRGVAEAIDDRFALLNKGRRTALPRHQTLRATLDWSFELLSETERRLLVRLSAFAGAFTLDAVTAVAVSDDLPSDQAVDAVSELISKSLLNSDPRGEELSFRLLDTTRAYAAQHLTALGEESARLHRRHAQYFLSLLERAEIAWRSMPVPEFISTFGRCIDDIRAALNWAFCAEGDGALGVALVAKAAPLFFQMSFTDEHRQYIERALAYSAAPDSEIDPRLEFELSAVAGIIIFNAHGLHPSRDRVFVKAAELADRIGDARLMAMASSAQWMGAYQTSNPQRMLVHAQQYAALTSGTTDLAYALHRDRILAPTWHLLGKQREALACCERGIADPAVIRVPFLMGVRIDRRVSMGCIHARVLWLLGRAEQAERAVLRAIEAAEREQEPVALTTALAFSACPLAIWAGRIDLARERLDRLLRLTAERALTVWRDYGLAFEAHIAWQQSGAPGHPPPLAPSVAALPQLSQLMATFHPDYVTDRVVEVGEAGMAGWCRAELLRVRAERLRESDPEGSERLLGRALELALHDETLPWALRAATSLARLWTGQHKADDAVRLLEKILALANEGLDARDVVAARAACLEAMALRGGG